LHAENGGILPRGEVAEWLNAPHSKCGIRATVSGVRIPPSPPVLVDRAPRRDDQDHRRHEEGDARASAAGSEPATGGSGGPFLAFPIRSGGRRAGGAAAATEHASQSRGPFAPAIHRD